MFVHSENAVESEFFLAPLDEGCLGIEQKNQCKYGHHIGSKPHHLRSGAAAGHSIYHTGIAYKMQDVVDADHKNTGHKIRCVEAAVFSHPIGRHLRIKTYIHARSPPCARRVSVSLIF